MKNKKLWYKIAVAIFVGLMAVSVSIIGFAAVTSAGSSSSAETAVGDAAPAEDAPKAENGDFSRGMGFLAAGLVTSLAGIGGGIAVAAGAPAAIAAAGEDPKNFGKSLIFVALGESIALYGVVISILILNRL